MLSGARRRPDPARDKHAQHVPVGEQRHVATGSTSSGYHPIHPRAHLLRLLATGASIAKQQPARRPLVDLLGRYSLIFAVVPLGKIGVDDRDRMRFWRYYLDSARRRAGRWLTWCVRRRGSIDGIAEMSARV